MDRAELPSLGFLNAAGMDSLSTIVISALVSTAVATAVNWFLGPRQMLRQDAARRGEEVRRRIGDTLQELRRRLIDERLQREALARGQHVVRNSETITGYEMLLLPVVRALDNPDADGPLREKLRTGLKELLGSWRLGYLAICDEPKTALDRYPVQPRNIDEGVGLLESLFHGRLDDPVPVQQAIDTVEQVLKNS